MCLPILTHFSQIFSQLVRFDLISKLQLYIPLNIFIVLIGIEVWNEQNEVEISSDADQTLKNFVQYRKEILLKEHPNDYAHLLTEEQFGGGVVGIRI